VRVLVTGATGKVGHAVAEALLERGDDVRALVRDPDRAARVVPEGAQLVAGDVIRPSSLPAAVEGCELVFNAMGLPEQWLRDEREFDSVNALGTRSLVDAAVRAGVRRVIHTSTIDVFHAGPGEAFDESQLATYPKGTAYERSKQRAEELALAAAEGSDTDVVFVNPSGVYGPGPGGEATSVEGTLIRPLIAGSRVDVPMLPPGGIALVHSPGLARGVLLAAEHGEAGERYIFCDGQMSFAELAETVVRIAGRGRVPRVMPVPVAKALAAAGESVSRLIGKPPLLPQGQLHFFLWNARPQSGKAQRELGWAPTPIEEGLRQAVASVA